MLKKFHHNLCKNQTPERHFLEEVKVPQKKGVAWGLQAAVWTSSLPARPSPAWACGAGPGPRQTTAEGAVANNVALRPATCRLVSLWGAPHTPALLAGPPPEPSQPQVPAPRRDVSVPEASVSTV